MSRRNYAELGTAEQVRVNAHIISYFRDNPNDFVNAFRRLVVENSLDDRAAGFQGVLDSLRDVMARNVKHLPPVLASDDDGALTAQRTLLRTIKSAMGAETERYEHDAGYYQKLVNDHDDGLPMPKQAMGMNPRNWLSVVAVGTINIEVAAGEGAMNLPRAKAPRER